MFRQVFTKLGQFVPKARIILVGAGVLILATQADAAVRMVKVGGAGLGNGVGWSNAYASIQSAINDVNATEVWVAAGTYFPTQENDSGSSTHARTKAFKLKSGVKVYGGFPDTGNPGLVDRNFELYPTVLSGDIGTTGVKTDNCYHVVLAYTETGGSDMDANTQLDGFTITKGYADGAWTEDAVLLTLSSKGGGLLVWRAQPVIQNCLFIDNEAAVPSDFGAVGGGGAHVHGNPNPQRRPAGSPQLRAVHLVRLFQQHFGGGGWSDLQPV